MNTTETREITEITPIPPEKIMGDRNIRFGLHRYRVDSMAASIISLGGIQEPITVTPLAEQGPDGEEFRVLKGHYRLAGAKQAAKQGHSIPVPCIVKEEPEAPVQRLKLQIVENMERQDFSIMDMAVAIHELLEAGVSKVEIRQLFSRPGGRKGLAMQPISNSTLNIYHRCLEFPKSIQNKIHDGLLGTAAIYELQKYASDNALDLKDPHVEEVLAKAEADRQKDIDFDEKLEKKYQEEEKKAVDAEARAKQDAEALRKAEELAAKAELSRKAKVDEAAEKYKIASAVAPSDKDQKAQAQEALKAAEAEKKAAEKVATEARAAAEKLRKKAEETAKLMQERKEKLAKAKEDASKKPVSPGSVKKAAAGSGLVKLSGTAMYKILEDGATLPGSYPKVKQVYQSFKKCWDSEITDTQLVSELSYTLGYRKERPKTLKEVAEEPVPAKAVKAGKKAAA